MKLTFFLIGFALIFLRVYFKGSHLFDNGKRTITITMDDGTHYTQLQYTGKIILDETETAFKTISPGGYVRFTRNENRLLAEGNLKGAISYELTESGRQVPEGPQAHQFIAGAIKAMIAFGFDAEARMERVYRKGGVPALLEELEAFQSAQVGPRYARRILATDSIQPAVYHRLMRYIRSYAPGSDKVPLLNGIPGRVLADSSLASVYFEAIALLQADIDKVNVVNHVIEKDTLTPFLFTSMLAITTQLDADIDKMNILQKLAGRQDLSETEWTALIRASTALRSDMDKSHILLRIAPNLHRSDKTEAAYRAAAQMIQSDIDYKRVIEALP